MENTNFLTHPPDVLPPGSVAPDVQLPGPVGKFDSQISGVPNDIKSEITGLISE